MVKVTTNEDSGNIVNQVRYLKALGLFVDALRKNCLVTVNKNSVFCIIECLLGGKLITFSGLNSHLQSLTTLYSIFTELETGRKSAFANVNRAREIMEEALGGDDFYRHEYLTMALLLAVGMSREEDLKAGLLAFGSYEDIIAAVELTHEGACSFAEAIAIAA